MHTHIGLRRLLIAALCSLAAACASEVDEGFATNTEINLDIVNPGGTSGELGFSIDRVDYRITCAGGAYLLPPFHANPSSPTGEECSTADLDNNGIPDSCPAGFNYIQGTAGPNNIVGTNGNDCIYGLGGNDVIDGGGGDDYICGGAGNDTLSGGNGNDSLFGGDGNDTLSGGNGMDALFGGPGDDALEGGNGDDLLDGGDGIDMLNGNNGIDTCAEEVPGSSTRLTSCESSYNDSVDISGAFEVVDTRVPPVWQAVMDLPPGNCTIALSVWEDDEVVCVGSQTLAITEDATTKYDIVLVCSLSIDTPDGMADVDGTFEFITGNLCPKLYLLNAVPSVVDIATFPFATEIQYRAKDPDNSCGNNCDPQSCTTDNPPVCMPYPSNVNDPNCNPAFGGNPNDPSCLAGNHAGLVCTLTATSAFDPTMTIGTFISPADGVTPVGPILPVNLNTAAGIPGIILPGLGGPAGTPAADGPAYPPLPNTNGSLPPLIYMFGILDEATITLRCSDGDAECDQTKQISTVGFTPNYCIQQPVYCSASAECLTDGSCNPFCDPILAASGLCDRCVGKDDPLPDGTLCSTGVCNGGVCDSSSCPVFTNIVITPLQVNVGDSIDVSAEASSLDGGPIDFLWTASAGSFLDPTSASTTYPCNQVGEHVLTVTASNSSGSCTDELSVTVTCL